MRKKICFKGRKFDLINGFLMILFAFICLFPLWYVVVGSFNDGSDYMRGGVVWIPRMFSIENYQFVLRDQRLAIGFRNTVLRTLIGTVLAVLYTSVVAYGMTRKHVPLRNVIYWINLFTMFFNGGMIPYYLQLKNLNLLNSFLVYILPYLYSVYNMIIFMNFFRDIPEEIHESAAVDGANEFTIYARLYLPISTPVLAVIALWVGVGHWNAYYDSMVYTTDSSLMTLQYYLLRLIKEAQGATGDTAAFVTGEEAQTNVTITTVRYAAIVLSTVPILCIYPFLQRYFTKGIMLGSLKG